MDTIRPGRSNYEYDMPKLGISMGKRPKPPELSNNKEPLKSYGKTVPSSESQGEPETLEGLRDKLADLRARISGRTKNTQPPLPHEIDRTIPPPIPEDSK